MAVQGDSDQPPHRRGTSPGGTASATRKRRPGGQLWAARTALKVYHLAALSATYLLGPAQNVVRRADTTVMPATMSSPQDVQEDNKAEFSFTLTTVDPSCKKHQRTKNGSNAASMERQQSPFTPWGSFKTCDTMDVSYQISPPGKWAEMTRYRSFDSMCIYVIYPLNYRTSMLMYLCFPVNGAKYGLENFVYVANDCSIRRQNATDDVEPTQPEEESEGDWVAYISEIRASDPDHVFARIYWMYRPDELPQGRQSYHGTNELIASNHSKASEQKIYSHRAETHIMEWTSSMFSPLPLR